MNSSEKNDDNKEIGEDENEEATKESFDKETEEEQEFRKRKDEKPLIPIDFFYDFESLVFKPVISEDSNLPSNLFHLL